jgi:hypothetical protein
MFVQSVVSCDRLMQWAQWSATLVSLLIFFHRGKTTARKLSDRATYFRILTQNIWEHNAYGVDYDMYFPRYVKYVGLPCFEMDYGKYFPQYARYFRIRCFWFRTWHLFSKSRKRSQNTMLWSRLWQLFLRYVTCFKSVFIEQMMFAFPLDTEDISEYDVYGIDDGTYFPRCILYLRIECFKTYYGEHFPR